MAKAIGVALASLVVLSAGCISGPKNVEFVATENASFDRMHEFRGEFYQENRTAVASGIFRKGTPCDGVKLDSVSREESTIGITVGVKRPFLQQGGCGDIGASGTYRVTVTNVSASVESVVVTEKNDAGETETHRVSTVG